MKAKIENRNGVDYLSFTPEGMRFPTQIPVITKGSRDDANAWTWNGSLETPTVRPSVRTQYVNGKGEMVMIHYWLNDGVCQCLSDCTDGNAGKNITLSSSVFIQIMEQEKEFTRELNPNFFKLWDLKCVQKWRDEQKHLKDWYSFEIYAKTTKDLEMNVWNGTHPVEENTTKHVCKAGTKVRVWMVSRFGDVGVTDNLENPKGYDFRGLDADIDLTNYDFLERVSENGT